jgi:hypothetical protein
MVSAGVRCVSKVVIIRPHKGLIFCGWKIEIIIRDGVKWVQYAALYLRDKFVLKPGEEQYGYFGDFWNDRL